MIGLLARFVPGGSLGVWVLLASLILAVGGGVFLKVRSYINEHEALEVAYQHQQLELNQAIDVNKHNIDEMARIQVEHEQTVAVLQGQMDSEATTRSDLEIQIERLRELALQEPEIIHVTNSGETCPDPVTVVSRVLSNPFGVREHTED